MPSPPSSGGIPSGAPSPSTLPGGTPPSSPGGQSGGQPSADGTPSGAPPSGGLPGGQPDSESGTPPGGLPGGMPGGSDAEGEAEPAEPTWEVEEGGGGAEGEGEWETSNEIPGGSQRGDSAGGGAEGGEDGAQSDGSDASTSGQGGDSGDDELDGALKDFDGEILAEREIINAAGEGPSGSVEIPTGDTEAGADGTGGEQQTASSPPRKRSIPQAPAPPRRGSESIPADIPDAKDDDIIARQLREAAMAERDPELKEKLWEEYRKYKKG